MKNYKLTWPRTLLFTVLLLGGIYYYSKNGFKNLETHEIVISVLLMVSLLILIVLKIIDPAKNRD
jgi:hypothetical protein